jgi:hypothetical protein
MDENIPRALTVPAGIKLTVPSALTGMPLTYFCPHPLRELARVWLSDRDVVNSVETSIGKVAGLLLVRCLLSAGLLPRSERNRASDFAIFLRPKILKNKTDLMRLWGEITGRTPKFRETISFSGGESPSSASHIFPPHQEIERLFDDLSAFIEEDLPRFSALKTIVLLHYYALEVHPFPNGNGRWARQMAIAIAARMGDVWSATILLTLFANHESRLVAAWRQAQDQGLGGYLDECEAYESRLKRYLEASIFVDSARELHAALVGLCGMRDADTVFCLQIYGGNLDQAQVSRLLGCSKKKSQGIFECVEGFSRKSGVGFSENAMSSRMELFKQELSAIEFFE